MLHQALTQDTDVVVVAFHRVRDHIRPAHLAQHAPPRKSVLKRVGMLLIVEVVDQAHDAPELLVLNIASRQAPHRRLHREAMLAQALRLVVLAEKLPGTRSIVLVAGCPGGGGDAHRCTAEVPSGLSAAFSRASRWS